MSQQVSFSRFPSLHTSHIPINSFFLFSFIPYFPLQFTIGTVSFFFHTSQFQPSFLSPQTSPSIIISWAFFITFVWFRVSSCKDWCFQRMCFFGFRFEIVWLYLPEMLTVVDMCVCNFAVMRSQLVCSGCRNILVYPRGASNVCCALCNTITSAPPPGKPLSTFLLIKIENLSGSLLSMLNWFHSSLGSSGVSHSWLRNTGWLVNSMIPLFYISHSWILCLNWMAICI